MPDITLCTGNCPVSEYCYRYMAKPNPYGQSYSNLESVCIPNGYSELIPYENKNNKIYTLEDFLLDKLKNQNETK